LPREASSARIFRPAADADLSPSLPDRSNRRRFDRL
jgi:hypothetical protein